MKSQISVLKNSLSGDLLDGKFDNGRYSTDASIYQIMPEAVILPKNIEDIKKTIQFSQQYNIPILPRGGGTSQNGQTVNRAIVLDNSKFSRHAPAAGDNIANIDLIICDNLGSSATGEIISNIKDKFIFAEKENEQV